MNKLSHIGVTRNYCKNTKVKHKLSLQFGSILPDILVYTYAYGHSYNQSLEHMIELISSLQTKKKESLINSIKMGYILHYFQDFFTYPQYNCGTWNI